MFTPDYDLSEQTSRVRASCHVPRFKNPEPLPVPFPHLFKEMLRSLEIIVGHVTDHAHKSTRALRKIVDDDRALVDGRASAGSRLSRRHFRRFLRSDGRGRECKHALSLPLVRLDDEKVHMI